MKYEMIPVFNVGLVGYGLSAKVFQLPFFKVVPQLRVHAILQRSPKPDDDAEKDYPGVKIYRTTREMFRDCAIDLALIGTSSDSHYSICKEALMARKNVLCEKPFTLTTAEANELISLAKAKNLTLSVFHNRRWDSDFQTVRQLIETGKLGRIVEFESHFDTHSPEVRSGWEETWRSQSGTGAGVLYDLGSHLIDQALVLFKKPVKVTAFFSYQRSESSRYGDPDSMTILMQYKDGLLVTLKSSVMNAEKEKLRFWYHLDVQESQIVNGIMPGSEGFGVEPTSHHGTFSSIGDSGEVTTEVLPTVDPPTYAVLYQQLGDALAGKANVPVTAESAKDIIEIIELALKSAREERMVYL